MKTTDQTRADSPAFGARRRDTDALPRERREGTSRLASWSGRGIAKLWLVWLGAIAGLLLLAGVLSIILNRGTQEIPLALTRANLRGLMLAILIPPCCLTAMWWRMHARRRGRPTDPRAMGDGARMSDDTARRS